MADTIIVREKQFWDIKGLSQYLQVKPSTLYAWAAQGKIPHLKLHRLLRFRREDIEQWLEARRPDMAPRPIPRPHQASRKGIDALIASAAREVYTPCRGETRPISSLIRKEERDGAV